MKYMLTIITTLLQQQTEKEREGEDSGRILLI